MFLQQGGYTLTHTELMTDSIRDTVCRLPDWLTQTPGYVRYMCKFSLEKYIYYLFYLPFIKSGQGHFVNKHLPYKNATWSCQINMLKGVFYLFIALKSENLDIMSGRWTGGKTDRKLRLCAQAG